MGQTSAQKRAARSAEVVEEVGMPPAPESLPPVAEIVEDDEFDDDYGIEDGVDDENIFYYEEVDGVADLGEVDSTELTAPIEFDDEFVEPEEVIPERQAPQPPSMAKRAVARVKRKGQAVEDLGVITAQPKAEFYIVRVNDDIGPVYHGDDLIEMQKNRKYRVPARIYEWLKSKNMIYGDV